jgi:hypothetical protein
LMKTLGLARLEAGRAADAAEALRRSLGGALPKEQRGETLAALGRARASLGDDAGALESFSQALLAGVDAATEESVRAGLARLRPHSGQTPESH